MSEHPACKPTLPDNMKRQTICIRAAYPSWVNMKAQKKKVVGAVNDVVFSPNVTKKEFMKAYDLIEQPGKGTEV